MNNLDISKSPENEVETLSRSAIKRCDELRCQYLGWKMMNLRRSNLAQTAALVFTAATPVVLLIQWKYSNIIGAGLSAVAAIATGLLATRGWRENFIRYGYVYHMLDIEKRLYEARATEAYPESDPKTAVRNFIKRVEGLVMMDATEWRAMMRGSEELNQRSEQLSL
jgi:hypothetical protein